MVLNYKIFYKGDYCWRRRKATLFYMRPAKSVRYCELSSKCNLFKPRQNMLICIVGRRRVANPGWCWAFPKLSHTYETHALLLCQAVDQSARQLTYVLLFFLNTLIVTKISYQNFNKNRFCSTFYSDNLQETDSIAFCYTSAHWQNAKYW